MCVRLTPHTRAICHCVAAQPAVTAEEAPPAKEGAEDTAAPGSPLPSSPDAAPTSHPWVGTWDLFGSEACTRGACGDKHCKPTVPGLVISEHVGMLRVSNFTLRALSDPMDDDMPFEYPRGAVLGCDEALAGPVKLVFDGANTGCGVESVTVMLHLTPDAARSGAPACEVKLAYDVRLGSLYKRKGHQSWAGSTQVFMQRRDDAAAAAAGEQPAAA
jgi:hypothetical protein